MDQGNTASLIPMVVGLGFFAMVFGIVYLYKRERMAMIERGMDPRRYKSQLAPYQNLKWGLLLIGSGLGLFFAFLLDNFAFRVQYAGTNPANYYPSDNPAIYFSLIAIFGGLGLFASYRIEKKETEKDELKEGER